MWNTLWQMLTVQNINAWATVILVAVTGYYAYQTRKLVRVEAERSAFEAKRTTRPIGRVHTGTRIGCGASQTTVA